jgi:hypothetical protein
MQGEDDSKVRTMVPDARWVRDRNGNRRLVEDEVDPVTWKARRREPDGWRNGAKVKRG